jgi:uncharacterized protein YprB with RNaseH-like and TPR domain
LSKLPIHRLKKDEIIWLATHHCSHGHTFLSHYGCYEPPETEKIGFLDIEASNLVADFGIVLSYCIKERGVEKILEGVLTPAQIKKAKAGDEDKQLITKCVEDLLKFDRIVTFYGTGFDLPFLRARALVCGVKFPAYGSIKHTDLYYLMRNKFKLSSRRLENCCRVLLGETQKTRIRNDYWRGAVRGDKKSLEYVLEHNRYDVIDLEKLYDKSIEYALAKGNSI